MILFLTETCSHCQRLDTYLTANSLYQSHQIQKIYIDHNPQNLALYIDTATDLGYRNGGVPLLIDDQTYIEGADPIINHLTGQTQTIRQTTLTQEDQTTLQQIIQQEPSQNHPLSPLYIALPIIIISVLLLLLRKRGYKHR